MDNQKKTYQSLLAHRIRVAAMGDDEDMDRPPPRPGQRPGESGNTKRQIPQDHDYDPRSLKPLAQTLWALSVSLGHLLTAHRQFSRLKSVSFSPDGLVGGRGYVMTVKDIRAQLFEASDHISGICDTLHDEINAPHWKPKLAELEAEDVEDVVKLLDDAEENLGDPEGEAADDMEEVEEGPSKGTARFQQESDASQLPDNEGMVGQNKPFLPKTAGYRYDRSANSSLPVSTLPGPRVDHLDRGEQMGPGGSYNTDEPPVDDGWGEHTAGSALPAEFTPMDADDFGIGYGAHGKGLDRQPENTSALPGDLSGNGAEWDESEELAADTSDTRVTHEASSWLPNDGEKPVARADYYEGFKDNDIDKGADSSLPGPDDTSRTVDYDAMDVGYTYERQGPMVVYDDATKTDEPDPLYSRRPE